MNIVVEALTQKLGVVVTKREGAEARLVHAEKQIDIETAMVAECERDIALIEDAILRAGGQLRLVEEGEEPYVDDV